MTFDPCRSFALQAEPSSDVQATGLADALALWRELGVSGMDDVQPDPEAIVVRFEPAARAFHGLYDDEHGVVYINSAIQDRDALSVVLAHELGHAFGLPHVERSERVSLMNPGNVAVPPDAGDQRALQALWGRCDVPAGVSSSRRAADRS